MVMKDFTDNDHCFACGTQNPQGLKLDFIYDKKNDQAYAKTEFNQHHQGWKNVLHGGIISTVLDEVMIKAAHFKGHACATIELSVRFKHPTLINGEYTIRGKVVDIRQKIVYGEASLTNQQNIVTAKAKGKFFLLPAK